MAGGRLFGDRSVGVVTLVEAPVSRSYARRARLTFFVMTAVVGLPAAVVLSDRLHPIVALVFGLVLGAGVGLVVATVVAVWPVLRTLWHWAAELALASGVVVGWTALMQATNRLVALLIVLAAAGSFAALRPLRRWSMAMAWCAIVRHRLRLCFAELIRAANRVHPGSLPLILIARPTPAGERVWVWLRPGLDLTDLEGKTAKLAVACWASEVRVVRASERYAALLRFDITRRDPLTATVGSPLIRLIPTARKPAESAPPLPRLGLDLPDVPEQMPETRGGRR
jgi:hypothetical protein